jgi:hypothetical protein
MQQGLHQPALAVLTEVMTQPITQHVIHGTLSTLSNIHRPACEPLLPFLLLPVLLAPGQLLPLPASCGCGTAAVRNTQWLLPSLALGSTRRSSPCTRQGSTQFVGLLAY